MITQYPRIPVPSNAVPDSYVYASTADQKYALGTILDLEDGRRFRYMKNGGVILYKALMAQAAAIETKWESEVQTAKTASVGDTDIPVLITTGSSLAAHEWDEGWIIIESGLAGAIGDMYKIASHTVHATAVTVTIQDPGGVRTALDANQVCTIIRSPYMAMIVTPVAADPTGQAMGVPLVDIPISYYGWIQSRGPCPLIVDTGETLVLGTPAGFTSGGITVAGTCGKTAVDDATYGQSLTNATAAEAGIVNLTIE
jgi:hypothetical protein